MGEKVFCSNCKSLVGRCIEEYACVNPLFTLRKDDWLRDNNLLSYGKCEALNKDNNCIGYEGYGNPPWKV